MQYAYIDEYTSFMSNVRHKSINTVESYGRDIKQYFTYLSNTGITDLSEATKTTVLTYLISLQRQGRSASTVSRTLASLRSFYIFMIQFFYFTSN